MAERDLVDGWLANLAADIGAERLCLDAAGVCAFRYDGTCDVVIEVPAGGGQVLFYAPLALGPESRGDGFHQHLLTLNAYMLGSRGGALGLDPQSGEVIFSRIEPVAALGPALFAHMLTNFVAAAMSLQTDLAARVAEPSAPRSETLDPNLTAIRV